VNVFVGVKETDVVDMADWKTGTLSSGSDRGIDDELPPKCGYAIGHPAKLLLSCFWFRSS